MQFEPAGLVSILRPEFLPENQRRYFNCSRQAAMAIQLRSL